MRLFVYLRKNKTIPGEEPPMRVATIDEAIMPATTLPSDLMPYARNSLHANIIYAPTNDIRGEPIVDARFQMLDARGKVEHEVDITLSRGTLIDLTKAPAGGRVYIEFAERR